jgi:hypothetical protein
MAQPTKQEILDSLKQEGITTLDQLAEQAEREAKNKNLNKPALKKVAGVFISVIVT